MEKELARWMNQFVRVRLIQCNSVDLNLFHFDYDLTFAAFFLNADKTLYGRYGTRSSHDEAEKDVSIEGFAKAMEKALALHRAYPGNRTALEGKKLPYSEFAIPQDYPHLEGRFQPWLDFEGKVAASCIHCHMVRDADRRYRRHQGSPLGDKANPWPMPPSGTPPRPKRLLVGRVERVRPPKQPGSESMIRSSRCRSTHRLHRRSVGSASSARAMQHCHDPSAGPRCPQPSLLLAGVGVGFNITGEPPAGTRRMGAGGLKCGLRTDERKNRGQERQNRLVDEHVGQAQ